MAIIRPFSALRPPPNRAKDVSSVPYDVVNTEEARALAEGNPLSFLHVSRPEIDLPREPISTATRFIVKQLKIFKISLPNCPLEREASRACTCISW